MKKILMSGLAALAIGAIGGINCNVMSAPQTAKPIVDDITEPIVEQQPAEGTIDYLLKELGFTDVSARTEGAMLSTAEFTSANKNSVIFFYDNENRNDCCAYLAGILAEAMEDAPKGIGFAKYEIDSEQVLVDPFYIPLIAKYSMRSIPTIAFYKDGKVVRRLGNPPQDMPRETAVSLLKTFFLKHYAPESYKMPDKNEINPNEILEI